MNGTIATRLTQKLGNQAEQLGLLTALWCYARYSFRAGEQRNVAHRRRIDKRGGDWRVQHAHATEQLVHSTNRASGVVGILD